MTDTQRIDLFGPLPERRPTRMVARRPVRRHQPANVVDPLVMGRALRLIQTRPELFRKGFADWVHGSWQMWLAFEREANRAWDHGRRHWSANTIIEYLRHETMLSDTADADFKFNDRWTSSLARLYGVMHRDRADLFEYRERHGGVVVGM